MTPRPPFVLLEDRLSPGAPARLYRDPIGIVCCRAPQNVSDALARIKTGLDAGLHAAGFLSYELGYALERRLAARTPAAREAPLLWFGLFPPPDEIEPHLLDEAFAAAGPPPPLAELEALHDRATHVAKVRRVLALIGAGDLYQVNLTFPFRFRVAGDPLALYAALRARQPVAHGGVVAAGDATILSVSPELFFSVRDGQITARPMKGTAARQADPAADAHAKTALAASVKDRAENLMIVDLLRNDLARISAPGTVRAPALFTAETYPTFHAMTSTITADLRPGVDLADIMAALFPCGSIVGAPKIRAAEVIADLEPCSRGVYTGAIGAIAPGGDMAFNVAIRTATIGADGRGTYGVGGGIVADSDPDGEYDEALLKARVLTDLAEDFSLIETLRWSAEAGLIRLNRHLDRMVASACALGFRFDRAAAETALAKAAMAWVDQQGDQRVRLELARDGRLDLTHQPASPRLNRPLVVDIASDRLDRADPYLRHKTSRRAVYERAFACAAAEGLDEAVLLNRECAVADGARHSVFLERGGRLLTPPLSAGALSGVLRAELLAEGRAIEADFGAADLVGDARWFLGNSLQGLRPACLVTAFSSLPLDGLGRP